MVILGRDKIREDGFANASARDSLFEGVASQFGKTLAQRCFSSIECILIGGNASAGMIFQPEMHPDSQECLGRDDFGAAECILICRKCLAGMNWNREMHPDWQEYHSSESVQIPAGIPDL